MKIYILHYLLIHIFLLHLIKFVHHNILYGIFVYYRWFYHFYHQRRDILDVHAWFIGNANWLYWAYHEIINPTENNLLLVWMAIFFIINNVTLIIIGESYDSYPLLLNYVKLPINTKKKYKRLNKKK